MLPAHRPGWGGTRVPKPERENERYLDGGTRWLGWVEALAYVDLQPLGWVENESKED